MPSAMRKASSKLGFRNPRSTNPTIDSETPDRCAITYFESDCRSRSSRKRGGTNAQTYPMRYQYPQGHRLFDTNFNYQGEINDDHLLHLMIHDPRARNFYYFGHGNSEWIGDALYAALERQYKTHRYRFVWLDGCETANGDWDKVFNINGPGKFSLEVPRRF